MALRTITLLIAMIIGGLGLAAAYISTLIIERQDALKRVSRYNTAWLASQAVSEFRQLQYGISAFAVPGSGVEREEVELRFDILLSRLKLLNSGEFQAFVQRDPARLEVIHQLNAVVH